MKCGAPFCEGLTHEQRCSDHGKLCIECLLPTALSDALCHKCLARRNGEKCAECGSPWIYITYYLDGNWRCRPCCMNIITENGWDETVEVVLERVKKAEEDYQAAIAARSEDLDRQREIQEKIAKKTRKPKQEESLFGDEKKKKK